MNPKYPIYIISKGRWISRLTSKALEFMNVPYHIIVEAHEYEHYASVIDSSKILILPQKYLDVYDTFWPRNVDNKTGPGPARNYAWQHSIDNGFDWHWVMDDNLDAFHRMNRNEKWEVSSGTIFLIMEDFVSRYSNIAIAGPNYYSFCKTTDSVPPFVLNTRIYSCLLINNKLDFRWRGRYNEDTDLSIRALKEGWCTIQFNAFLQGKVTTQRMSGGNTNEFYNDEGTLNKSKILEDMHPDCVKVTWKFNRWHHQVDYRKFKQNKLIRNNNSVPNCINNYGLKLIEVKKIYPEMTIRIIELKNISH